jgi:hypothetical protein
MFMACTRSPDPWLAHLAKATGGLTLECSGNMTTDLQRLIDSLFSITQGGSIDTARFTAMKPFTITNTLPSSEVVADRITLQTATWEAMFSRFKTALVVDKSKKFAKRLTSRGAGEATALVLLILEAMEASEPDLLSEVIHFFDPADQPFVAAAWRELVQAFKEGVAPDVMCEVTFETLFEQLKEMKGRTNAEAFLKLGELISGIMANLRFMKRPDGSLDLANSWSLSIDPKVGTTVVTLATFGALQVDDGFRKDPSSRLPCNIVVPWCPKAASPIFKAVWKLFTASRFFDTATTGILTGKSDCFPSMHPGMVMCTAWALMSADTERTATLVEDAFDMMRNYGRPLSPHLWRLFDKGQGSPEPSPQQLLASFLRWSTEFPDRVRGMAPCLMAELVQAFAMVDKRYNPEYDWASLVDVSAFNPLQGAHPVEGNFTLCPVAWMETLPESKLYKQAANLARVLQQNGIPVEVDLDLVAQCSLLEARTDRYDLIEKVHVPKVVPPLTALLGAKVAKAVKAKVAAEWTALREAHVEANLVEQVVAATMTLDSSPASVLALAAKLKEMSFLPPWARGAKKVSRAHLAHLFDKLTGDHLKLAVTVFALDDSWTTESPSMVKSFSERIVEVLDGELKEAFTARMKDRPLCKRSEGSNRHGHSGERQAASVLDDAPPLRNRWPNMSEEEFNLMLATARVEVKKIRATPLSKAARAKMEEFLDKNATDVTSFQTSRAAPRSRAMRLLHSLHYLDAACEAYEKLATKPALSQHQVHAFFETPMEALTKSKSLASIEHRADFWKRF